MDQNQNPNALSSMVPPPPGEQAPDEAAAPLQAEPAVSPQNEIPPQAAIPPQTNYYAQNPYYKPAPEGKGQAITGMVLGICSIVLLSTGYIGFICGILGIIFSVIGKKKCTAVFYRTGRGMAIAGLVCSIVGLVLSTLYILLIAALFEFVLGGLSAYGYNYYF